MSDQERDRESPQWNPYLAGVLSGLLVVVSAAATGNFFGASSSFVRSAGMIERLFGAEHVAGLSYFARYVPRIDWQWLFLAGVLAGAALSATTSRTFRWQAMPPMWASRFGSNATLRGLVAFGGGVIAMFGARIAGG